MSRLNDIIDFIEFEKGNGFIIEPDIKFPAVKERLFDVIETYKPGVIVKAGLGRNSLLIDIAENFESEIVVVEPSFKLIKDFLEMYKGNAVEKIRFLNGDFHEFPVDYYAADLLICIDYLDFFDSSRCLDEFKIAIKFEGIFFFSGVVLEDKDIDGVYDDFKRLIFPLHNDYYLANDFRTFIELKDFTFLKSNLMSFECNLKSEIEYFKKKFENYFETKSAKDFIEEHSEEFKRLYNMDEDNSIKLPYYIGYFMRNKLK